MASHTVHESQTERAPSPLKIMGIMVAVQAAIWAAFLIGGALAMLPTGLIVMVGVALAGLLVGHRWMRRRYVDCLPDPGGE